MDKRVTKEQYAKIREQLRKENKKVVLCHGVFDLIHPGHILHFEEAKNLGDILVVSVTAAEFVRKGPGRPYFNDELRLKFLSAIECIDYVMLSNGYTVEDIIENVEPDLYVKGQEYAVAEDDITGKIQEEVELVRKHGGDIYYTEGDVFSSTKLINHAFGALPEEVKDYAKKFKASYGMDAIKEYTEKIRQKKILVIGDAIIDEYLFCKVQGLMSKDTGYSTRYIKSEQYLGGALAIANHLSSFCDNVTLTTILGSEADIHSRILNELSNKMRVDLVYSNEFETITKKRYITQNEKREEVDKIFAINNLQNPMIMPQKAMAEFKEKLTEKAEEYDTVILCDFGHGLVDSDVIEILEKKAKILCVNCQTNSSNYGINVITKYNRADIFTLDQRELQLAFNDYKQNEEDGLKKLANHLQGVGWLTQGAKGATSIEKGNLQAVPAFTLKVKDTIGAGDAFYSLASAYVSAGAPVEVGTFVGNAAGALAANIIGNKESVEKVDVLKYISTILNI